MHSIILDQNPTISELMSLTSLLGRDWDCDLKLADQPALIIGVSGGSDSLALLFLIDDYLKVSGAPTKLIAVTVDHGLRKASAAEAEQVKALCHANGIEHKTVYWVGDKPLNGVAAAARAVRYRLLTDVAREAGAQIIITAHTSNDQVETYLMRRQRVSQQSDANDKDLNRGLAGMASQTLLQGEYILYRPLLTVSREVLRDYLTSKALSWIDDPTNCDQTYERPRIRAQSATLDHPKILSSVDHYARLRLRNNKQLAECLSGAGDAISQLSGDCLVLHWGKGGAFDEVEQSVRILALAYLAALIGGRNFLPSSQQCRKLCDQLTQFAENKRDGRITLHGCIFSVRGEYLYIWRENRGLYSVEIPAATDDLSPASSGLWDKRFLVMNNSSHQLICTAPNWSDVKRFCRDNDYDSRDWHREAVLTSPAIYQNNKLLDMPLLTGAKYLPDGICVQRHFSCFDTILSGHDFFAAEAIKQLFNYNA